VKDRAGKSILNYILSKKQKSQRPPIKWVLAFSYTFKVAVKLA